MENLREKIIEYAEANNHPWDDGMAVLVDHSDGIGPRIGIWLAPWPQPTNEELNVFATAAAARKNREDLLRLTWQIVRENFSAETNIPLAEVSRDRISEEDEKWNANITDPNVDPQEKVESNAKANFLRQQYQKRRRVDKRIATGVYTTEEEVRNANEWN